MLPDDGVALLYSELRRLAGDGPHLDDVVGVLGNSLDDVRAASVAGPFLAAAGAVVVGPLKSMPPVDLPRGVRPFVSPLPAITASVSTIGTTATFRSLFRYIQTATGGPWLSVDPSVRARAMDAIEDVSADEYRKIFGALFDFDSPDLSHVETPILVLYGDREATLVKRQGDRLANTVARGTAREIPDAGHLVNQDNPAAFNERCAEFFASLASEGAREGE